MQFDYDDGAFTPYGGVVLDVSEAWSAYASYAEILQVQNALSFGGGRLDPIVGANYEIGMKGELRDGALSAAIAVYFITKENVAQRDPLHPGLTNAYSPKHLLRLWTNYTFPGLDPMALR